MWAVTASPSSSLSSSMLAQLVFPPIANGMRIARYRPGPPLLPLLLPRSLPVAASHNMISLGRGIWLRSSLTGTV